MVDKRFNWIKKDLYKVEKFDRMEKKKYTTETSLAWSLVEMQKVTFSKQCKLRKRNTKIFFWKIQIIFGKLLNTSLCYLEASPIFCLLLNLKITIVIIFIKIKIFWQFFYKRFFRLSQHVLLLYNKFYQILY